MEFKLLFNLTQLKKIKLKKKKNLKEPIIVIMINSNDIKLLLFNIIMLLIELSMFLLRLL